MDNNKIQLFENKKVRSIWDAEKGEWFFSVVDVCGALSGSVQPRKYWNDLKTKLKAEGSELSEKIGQLKLPAEDGKMRETDVLDTKGLEWAISSRIQAIKRFKEAKSTRQYDQH